MPNGVNDWEQAGRFHVWRYADPKRGWKGWHFAADPIACRSVRSLLDRMRGGEGRSRSLNLEPITDAILSVPNYGRKSDGCFERMRIDYLPEFENLRLVPEGDRLIMTVGHRRLGKLAAALAAMEVGDGDFGIATADDRDAETWMFWWMPDVRYHQGKR